MTTFTSPSLTSTLILALSQSEAVKRQLEDSVRIIARLERENEKLKQEIYDLRQQQQPDKPEFPARFDHLFRQDAEKQAEVDSLRQHSTQSTNGTQQSQTPKASCPNISADEQTITGTTHKRKKLSNQECRLMPDSSPAPRPAQIVQSRRVLSDRGAEAIPFIAEDGADPSTEGQRNRVVEPARNNSSANARLQALLSPTSPASKAPSRLHRRAPNVEKGPEDDEPLRCRPLHRLSLTHFKVNPKYTNGLDFVFQEVVRNKEARKCLPSCSKPECCGASFSALARTLPLDTTISEDDLLLEYLGPGSEQRILGLTPLARSNLVHEARAKRLANAFGRMHRANFETP